MVAGRHRGRAAADQRRHVRSEPDERGRRGGDVPAAPQRDGPLAAARVPAPLGARKARSTRSRSSSLSPGARRRFARSSIRTPSSSWSGAATCRAAIQEFCRQTNQPEPSGVGEIVRCVLESLALKHAETVDVLRGVTGSDPAELHVVGGGARNELLCAWTAEATGLPVLAGPEEATLLGNLLVQAIALGEIASLAEAREVVRASFEPTRYEPVALRRVGGRTRALRAAAQRRGAGGERVSSATEALHGIPAPVSRWDGVRGRRPGGARRARLPLEPPRRRSGARQHRRRQHFVQGDRARPCRPGRARALGEGLRAPTSRRSRRPASPGFGSTSCCRCASAPRWTTPRWSSTCFAARCARTSRGRRSRRSCTRSSRPRTSTTRTRTR